MSKILIADLLRGAGRLATILREHELVYTNTVAEAMTLAKHGNFDLVIIGMLFDDSRMFDLIRAIKSNAKLQQTPVMGFCNETTTLSGTNRDVTERVSHLLGACDYVDTNEMNDAEILERIRTCLRERKGVGRELDKLEQSPSDKRRAQEQKRKPKQVNVGAS